MPGLDVRYLEKWSTPNLSVLSGASLVVGLTRQKMVHPAGLPPANSPFEAEDDNNFTTDALFAGNSLLPAPKNKMFSPLVVDFTRTQFDTLPKL